MKKIPLLAAALLTLNACRDTTSHTAASQADSLLAENGVPSADSLLAADDLPGSMPAALQGSFDGMLPCEGCKGLKTRLTLSNDGAYVLERFRPEVGEDPAAVMGSYTWSATDSTASLDPAGHGWKFRVTPTGVVQLGPAGKPYPTRQHQLTRIAE